ncbi:MAG: GAF domain-containing protein [Capsulimonadaceae bacterium]|nr:GAF domain-containing protein [Capsulimonadaceae bacterium]
METGSQQNSPVLEGEGFPDDRAAQIVASAADGPNDAADAASHLLPLVQRSTNARSAALFRTVQDTGLLVPCGRPAFGLTGGLPRQRLTTAMTRAADAAAAAFVASARKHGEVDPAFASSRRVFLRRSPGPPGASIYALAVVRQGEGAKTSQDVSAVAVAAPDPITTALLSGVWVVIVDDEEAGKRPGLEALLRRIHVYWRLLLRQQALREAADTAHRLTEKRLREVATIYEIGKAVDKTEIEGLFHLITMKAASVMDAQACSLLLKETNSEELTIAASCGLADEVVENTRVFVGQGIAGRVAQTGDPLLVNYDVRADPRFTNLSMKGLPGISSSISMPMKDEADKVIGVLCIRRRTPAPPFSADDERLFGIFASQASMAIKNARLYGELRSRVNELSTLSSLAEAISSKLDLDHVLNQLADDILNVVGYDRCLIYLRDDDPQRAWRLPRISRGFVALPDYDAIESAASGPKPTDMVALVAARQTPLMVEDLDGASPEARLFASAHGIRSFYAHPIIVSEHTIGVVIVSADVAGLPLGRSNLDLLVTFLQHAGIAIENARLYKQMQMRIDELNTLHDLSRSLATTFRFDKSSETVRNTACNISRSDVAFVFLFNERQDSLRVQSHQGATAGIVDLLRVLPDATEVASEARLLREPIPFSVRQHAGTVRYFGDSWREFVSACADAYSSLLLVPLVTEEVNVGFILLGRKDNVAYEPATRKLLSIIAAHAAAVLRSAAAYEYSIEQRVLELSALYELSKKVQSARSMVDACKSIVDIVKSVVMCDAAYLSIVDKDRRSMEVLAWHGLAPSEAAIEHLDESASIAAWVVKERMAFLTPDVQADPRFASTLWRRTVRSVMVIPVFLADDALGVLQVQSASRNLYTEDNVKMLSLIAGQAAALYREVRSLRDLTSYTDNILHSIAAGVVTLDAEGRIVTVNQAAERILRISSRQVLGMPFQDMLPMLKAEQTDHDDTLKLVSMAIATGGAVQRHRLRYFATPAASDGVPTPDTDEVIVNGSASPLRSERGDDLGVVVVFEDVTKEQEMEQELHRISRLAEIGQLAAGIAHELRNPLASIKGAAQVLKEDLPAHAVSKHGEFLDIIVNEVNVLNGVTTEFLEFSRPETPQFKLANLNDVISRRLAFLRPEFENNDIAVHESYDRTLGDMSVDPAMMDRVITNIALNAVQAMQDGGTFMVETGAIGSGADQAVWSRFSDTGIGMDPERRANIFTPFFTTKTKGTGLGLSIVERIIDAHGGRIHVESEPGKGTAFTIWLPVSSPYRDRLTHVTSQNQEISEQRLYAVKKLVQPLTRDVNLDDEYQARE